MAFSFDDIIPILTSQLTEDERANGVLYAVATPLKAGIQLTFPGITITPAADSFIAFVDRRPLANWGHPARYILIDRENGRPQSQETRLPPFRRGGNLVWQVIYRAPGVPDNAINLG